MNELDTKWIEEFEQDEEIYKDFYKDPIESVRVFLLYVDKKNNLFHFKK
jgi:hypothetical protein